VAFEMYDTFGFPVDLTQLILKENDIQLDLPGFEAEMKSQKARSREDASMETADWTNLKNIEGTEFTGYQNNYEDVVITKYRNIKSKGKESFHLVFDKTPFYAEAGGQVGDTGFLISDNEKITIKDTVKENNLIVHLADKLPSDPGSAFKAMVDVSKRSMTANNHSATHLLHFALRTVLGNHVEQKGSLVTPDKLRFDFSHFSKLSKEELSKVEELVNRMIRENHNSRVSDDITMEKANDMGAMALFGEKYGERVRVVEFGESVELCGGIHVKNTGTIGFFKIISEGAIAAGIRRIEAVTALKAEEYINDKLNIIEEISSLVKSTGNLTESVEKLVSENSAMKKKIEKFQAETVATGLTDYIDKAIFINNIKFVSGQLDIDSPDALKQAAYQVRNTSENTVFVIGSAINEKASIIVLVSDDLVKERNINAVTIIREIAGEISGSGGGQPFLATAGGKNPEGIKNALKKAENYLKNL
jgi:alanyl-tRNA synthetase